MRGPNTTSYRRDLLWIAALVHRLSGVLLAIFLPLHFLVLGLALDSAARLDGFLRWTDLPMVKAAEAGLVTLLSVHLLGGVRVLLIERAGTGDRSKRVASAAMIGAALVGLAFWTMAR